MEQLLQQVLAYTPWNEQEEADKKILLSFLHSGEDILTRNNEVAHLTASAWVVSPDRSSVLMAYHNLYDSWAWLGGHADGDGDLMAVAMREVTEESGLSALRPLQDGIFSLETLCVNGHEKRGKYVPSHLHLNVTYLFEGDCAASLAIKPDENSAVAWIPVSEIAEKSTEPWFVQHIYGKLCQKVSALPQSL